MVLGCWVELWSWKHGGSTSSASSWRANNQILGSRGESVSALGAVWRWEKIQNLSGGMDGLHSKFQIQNPSLEVLVATSFAVSILPSFKYTSFIYINMIASFHLVAFLVHEYFTPEWQRRMHDITRKVVAAMEEID